MAQREVARLLTRIEQECASARSGLSGLASGTARHAFLSGKMERIETCRRALCGLLGEPEATRAAERLEGDVSCVISMRNLLRQAYSGGAKLPLLTRRLKVKINNALADSH